MSNSFNPIIKRKVRYTYSAVQEILETEENEKYVSYGISVKAVDDEIAFVSDVSTELEEVQRLAELCTEQELAPEHLCDVIEDFLNAESISAT